MPLFFADLKSELICFSGHLEGKEREKESKKETQIRRERETEKKRKEEKRREKKIKEEKRREIKRKENLVSFRHYGSGQSAAGGAGVAAGFHLLRRRPL